VANPAPAKVEPPPQREAPTTPAAPAPVVQSAPAPASAGAGRQSCGCSYKGECLTRQPVQQRIVYPSKQTTGLLGRGCRLLHR
jgi:hypothetical protein